MNEQGSDTVELHACCGLNACKGQGKDGSGDMAGTGQCATAVQHTCAGGNDCKGQGGCGYGSAFTQSHPGANHCKGQGGCGSPIGNDNAPPKPPETDKICTQLSSKGLNDGHSVWNLARALFEQRMQQAGIAFGEAPCCSGGNAWQPPG